jgi:hypothetical protein
MFIAALFTIAKLWKQPRCPTIDEWNKKMWYLYTMEYYSDIKKNEILSFTGKWMELENIILREVSQALLKSTTLLDGAKLGTKIPTHLHILRGSG